MNLISYIKKSLQDRRLNAQRDIAVRQGYFLYYIVSERTNVRKRYDDDTIVIYDDREIAEMECDHQEEIIRVSEYDRIFGSEYDRIFGSEYDRIFGSEYDRIFGRFME